MVIINQQQPNNRDRIERCIPKDSPTIPITKLTSTLPRLIIKRLKLN